MTTFRVRLSHGKNPDIKSGYWTVPEQSGKARLVACNSIEHASRICRSYLDRNELGGGNWTGGEVQQFDAGIWKPIGRIAYNGLFFPIN